MENVVIFLGAGASKADGAPLQGELFQSFIECVNKDIFIVNKKREIKVFFREFFGIDNIYNNDDNQFPTFEEALGVLDIAIQRKEEYKRIEDLNELRNSLVYSMAKAIQYELDYKNRTPIIEDNHYRLIYNLEGTRDTKNVSFISTNYDILIDNAIYKNQYLINYGVKYDKNLQVNKNYNLNKIHGSLGWLLCPACNNFVSAIGQKVALDVYDLADGVRCRKCRTQQRLIIVPPTYFKDMSNPVLSRTWITADASLRKADHIIFCGYSFPDADVHIKYLIKRAEINRSNHNHLKVTVLNHFSGKDYNISKDEYKRYFRFLSKKTKLRFLNIGFARFATDPLEIIDGEFVEQFGW